MKRVKRLPIYLFFSVMLILSFIFGYRVIGKKINSKPDHISKINTKDLENEDYPDLEILKEYDKISPNTLIEERIHYSTCGHVITKVNPVEDELINMTKKEFSEYMEFNSPNKRLITYSANKITMGVIKNHLCEKHYIIGEKDGNIAIFKVGENGEKIADKIFTDYPISLLMEIDQEKIIEGIVVENEEQLSEILENFIS